MIDRSPRRWALGRERSAEFRGRTVSSCRLPTRDGELTIRDPRPLLWGSSRDQRLLPRTEFRHVRHSELWSGRRQVAGGLGVRQGVERAARDRVLVLGVPPRPVRTLERAPGRARKEVAQNSAPAAADQPGARALPGRTTRLKAESQPTQKSSTVTSLTPYGTHSSASGSGCALRWHAEGFFAPAVHLGRLLSGRAFQGPTPPGVNRYGTGRHSTIPASPALGADAPAVSVAGPPPQARRRAASRWPSSASLGTGVEVPRHRPSADRTTSLENCRFNERSG